MCPFSTTGVVNLTEILRIDIKSRPNERLVGLSDTPKVGGISLS
jgi:hypothetical protein